MSDRKEEPNIGDNRGPGWVDGWGVVKGPPEDREFLGIFADEAEAEREAAKAGPGYEVRWGSYNKELDDFVTGDTL